MVYITWDYVDLKIYIIFFFQVPEPLRWRSWKLWEVKKIGTLFSNLKVHHIWWARQFLIYHPPLSVMELEIFGQWLSKSISNIPLPMWNYMIDLQNTFYHIATFRIFHIFLAFVVHFQTMCSQDFCLGNSLCDQ